MFRSLSTDALAALAAAKSPADVEAMLGEWSGSTRNAAVIRDVLYRPMAMADMAGSLFVREVEMSQRIKLGDERRETFLELPFEEAVQFFEQRFQDPERALEVIRAYRDRASDAAKRTLTKLAERMIRQLQADLANGGTLAEFVAQFESKRFDASYLENVYRTNVQTAYGAGRVREIEAVAEDVGFVEYVTAGDNRVRAEHEALDGKVWRATDPAWKQFAPPNGFQCRCSLVTREQGDFEPAQLSRTVAISDVAPEFRSSPVDIVNTPL